MSDRTKAILQVLGIVVVFFLVAPYLLRGILTVTSKSRVVVRYQQAVRGRITGSEVNRQYYLYYLNGDTKQRYDFNSFERPLTPAEQQLIPEEQDLLGLAHHLKIGDYVTKEANSATLMVQRGDSTSRWTCPAEPAAK